MNCLLAGEPTGTTLEIAAMLLRTNPGAPVTLLSDDTEGLLAAIDRPGLAGCEILWADPHEPARVDEALVHRRMVHGRPDVVLVVVDERPETEAAWTLLSVLLPRLSGTPLLVTGHGASPLAPRVAELLRGLADETAHAPVCAGVPGADPGSVLQEAERLVRAAPAPEPDATRALLQGHCAH